MKTLFKLVVPLLAACLVIPAANAHPDSHNDRNYGNDRHSEYRHGSGNRNTILNRNYRVTRNNLDYRRYRPRTERGREYYRKLVDEHRKHRHPYDRVYRTRTGYSPVRNGHNL